MTDEDIARELGTLSAEMKAMRSSQDRIADGMDRMDERLRVVEKRAALNGAGMGAVMGVAVAFIKDAFTG